MQMPTLSRRKLGVAAGAAALLAMTALAACDPAPDGKVTQLTLAGSDTTQEVIGQIASQYNADAAYNTDGDVNQNVLAQQFTAKTVPADDFCGSVTWHTPAGAGERLAPNGSGAGRDALLASVARQDGCVDVARSSAPPRPVGTVPAPTWRRSTTSPTGSTRWRPRPVASTPRAGADPGPAAGHLPLHLHQLEPVGGANAADRPLLAAGRLGHPLVLPVRPARLRPDVCRHPAAPAPNIHRGEHRATIDANGDAANAIVPFSAGNWVAQARGTDP